LLILLEFLLDEQMDSSYSSVKEIPYAAFYAGKNKKGKVACFLCIFLCARLKVILSTHEKRVNNAYNIISSMSYTIYHTYRLLQTSLQRKREITQFTGKIFFTEI